MSASLVQTEMSYDLVVCGGGVGGVITAVMAARKGLSVALLDTKAGLGGNACSEIGVSIDGAHFFGFFTNMREGGPVEELKERIAALDPYVQHGQNSTVMLFWCQEAGVRVYSELLIDQVETEGRRIVRVAGSQGGTERRLVFHAHQFVDATGDGSIAALAGAAFMTGREGRATFGETLAPENADTGIMGASLLFRASEKKEATTFVCPPWAYQYRKESDLPHRLSMQWGPVACGFWWIEFAGDHDDPLGEYEQIRLELTKCLYGAWAFLKNEPSRGMDKWSLDRVSITPAKRESRRIIGDVVVTEKDIVERTAFPDAIAYAGWNIDIHVPGGFKSPDKPNIHAYFPWIAPLPMRALYARDLDNLWLVGRDISVSHVALGTTRLQATIGTMGHAVACAAVAAQRHGLDTRETVRQHITAIQQEILRDGSYIPGIRNVDPLDHARSAVCTATSDLPLGFEPGDALLPVGKGRALSFPVVGGRIETVTIPLRNPGAVPVEGRLFFSSCLHPNHVADLAPLATRTVRIEPGDHVVSWALSLSDLPDGLYAVGITTASVLGWKWQWPGRTKAVEDAAAAVLEWRASREAPCGCHTLVLDPDHFLLPGPDTHVNLYAVNKPIMMASAGEDTRWVREKTNRVWRPQHQDRNSVPVPCIGVTPVLHPYAAVQVVSGVSHTDRLPDLWISDPARTLPQTLELSWKNRRTLAEVRLVFDSDGDMSCPAFEPINTLVKSYRLEVRDAGGLWREVAREVDNRSRFRMHTFPAVAADALRLVVDAVHANGKSARVFEIRCYS